MLFAGGPGFAPVRGVDPRIVPRQDPVRWAETASGAAPWGLFRFGHEWQPAWDVRTGRGSCRGGGRVGTEAACQNEAIPGSHGGSRPASRLTATPRSGTQHEYDTDSRGGAPVVQESDVQESELSLFGDEPISGGDSVSNVLGGGWLGSRPLFANTTER
jgi:hypothetical protein